MKTPSRAAAQPGNSAEVATGRSLFEQHCAICHYSQSEARKIGPGLKGWHARAQTATKKAEKADDALLIRVIEKGGKNMPGEKKDLTADQVRALIAYVDTL